MSEYQFDKDKILANAKKGRFAKRSPMPIYIGVTAAAAAVVVGVGTVLFTSLGGNKGVDLLTGSNITALSDKQRIERAIEELRRNENSDEFRDVMVTFSEPLSTAETQRVLTKHVQGSVLVKMLYFSDETRVVGAEAVGKAFEKGEGLITGAVVNCTGNHMEQLQMSAEVFVVEAMTAEDSLNVVAPIKTDAPDIPNIPDIDIGGNTPDVRPPESSDGTSDNSGGSDVSGGEPDESGDSSDSSGESVVDAPAEIPDNVKLPLDIDGVYSLTEEIYAREAFFVDEKKFFAISAQGIALYEFDGYSESLIAYQQCENANVEWISEDGSEMLVTACEDGRRSKLFSVDAKVESFVELDVEGIVMTGEITDIAFDKDGGYLIINVFEDGRYYTCSAILSGGEAEYVAVSYYCADGKTHVLCMNGDYVYLLVERENGAEIVKSTIVGGSDGVVIYSTDKRCVALRNLAGTYAAVSFADGSFIFDPVTESLVEAPAGGAVDFGAARNSFFCGGAYYTIENGEISAASGLDVIAEIDWRNSFSSKYRADISGSRIRITASSYNEKNSQQSIHFGSPYENASAEMRESVNNAIGLQNALAKSMLGASGINSLTTLNAAIKAIYTDNAADLLRNRCNIAQTGELSCTKGGLGTINASETVLVIGADDGETASGTLYVKVGTFNGVSGYRSVGVSLVKISGKWRVNGIVE